MPEIIIRNASSNASSDFTLLLIFIIISVFSLYHKLSIYVKHLLT